MYNNYVDSPFRFFLAKPGKKAKLCLRCWKILRHIIADWPYAPCTFHFVSCLSFGGFVTEIADPIQSSVRSYQFSVTFLWDLVSVDRRFEEHWEKARKMDRFSLSVISLLVLILSITCSVDNVNSADLLYAACSDQYGQYPTNSTFENNLKRLLGSLISYTPTTGFNNTLAGENPDRVYGQALCRGDINSTECQDCLVTAARGIMDRCNRTQDAMIWYDLCQIRYSFQRFFSLMVYTGKYTDSSYPRNTTSDPARLYSYWKYMMTNISSEAAFHSSLRMFATGEVNMSASIIIYGLVQCTRDISAADCNMCLTSALGDLQACCYSREGGTIVSRNCNTRFEMYKFYNGPATSVLTYSYSNGENSVYLTLVGEGVR